MEATQISSPCLILYTSFSPNGQKVSITLEELGLNYEVKPLDLMNGEQKEEWFLKINPNGRIPALVDKSNNDFASFESGAIMLYLVDKYDKDNKLSFPHGTNLYWEMVSWLFFQNAGIGPMQGQYIHFLRFAPEKIEYAKNRYYNEVRRLYSVLNQRLKENGDWLVGDKYTIADIASFTWVNFAFWGDIDLSEFSQLKEWCDRINKREAVAKGLDVPFKFELKKKFEENKEEAVKQAISNGSWILKQQKTDAEKKYKE